MLGRAFTIMMNLAVFAIVAGITFNELSSLLILYKNMISEGSKVPVEFLHQSAVGVILVALGVVLEGRHTFVLSVMKFYKKNHLPGQEEFSDACELFGFYILIMGLMVECFGELVKFVDIDHPVTMIIFCCVSIILNLFALGFLLRLSVKVSRFKLS